MKIKKNTALKTHLTLSFRFSKAEAKHLEKLMELAIKSGYSYSQLAKILLIDALQKAEIDGGEK